MENCNKKVIHKYFCLYNYLFVILITNYETIYVDLYVPKCRYF